MADDDDADRPRVWWSVVGDPRSRRIPDRGLLDPEEAARARALHRPEDRAASETAHVLAREVLGTLEGRDPATLRFTRWCGACGSRAHGRPELVGSSRHLSLTHAELVVAVAVDTSAVGVDVEPVVTPAVAEELVGSLHPEEAREVRAAARPDELFTRLWARKEALLKALGTGLSDGMRRLYVGCDHPERHPAGWRIEELSTVPGHRAAVCVTAGRPEVGLFEHIWNSR